MKVLTLEVDGQQTTTRLPENWNELTTEQALTCYTLIKTNTGTLLEPELILPYKRIQLAQHLMGIDDDWMELWEQDCIDTHGGEDGTDFFLDELDQLLQQVDFLFDKIEPEDPDDVEEEQPSLYQIRLGLTKCPFPVISNKKKKLQSRNQKNKKSKYIEYYGPLSQLSNITIYELGMTFTAFEQFINTKEEEHAHRLLAILYRPKKLATQENLQSNYEGDIRLPLTRHESTIDKRMEKMATLPPPVKHLLLFWFASCRQHIIENNRQLFPEAQEGDKGNSYGWGDVILRLAGGLVNLENISNQVYTNVFAYLRQLENDRLKSELRQAEQAALSKA